MRDDLEKRVAEAGDFRQRRDALLDRAAFYLLWQSALRVSEVEELRLEDLDLPGQRLTVRQGKGLTDRTVLLTDTTVRSVQEYLAVRGPGPTNHVFLYRNQPVTKDLLRSRIKAAGVRAGVKATPHQLRHTAATQLLNAGCRVTSIQKLLGHKELNTTMIYARVHDRTVADDYYSAMEQVERQMDLAGWSGGVHPLLVDEELGLLFDYVDQLANPVLSGAIRMEVAGKMKQMLAILRGGGWSSAAAAETLPTERGSLAASATWGRTQYPAMPQHGPFPVEAGSDGGRDRQRDDEQLALAGGARSRGQTLSRSTPGQSESRTAL